MRNAVLERFREARAEQIATMDAILEQVTDRDLVDAERTILEACRARIAELDAQIEPLAAYETLREQHRDVVDALPRPPAVPARPVGMTERDFPYPTAGSFIVDYLRAHGLADSSRQRDDAAVQRVAAAYAARADFTTGDTVGILPTPIVGAVVNLIDANRPLVTSLGGARSMAGIPGLTFTRPKINQHVTVGKQAGEKQALPSQKMTIGSVPFTKETYGGSVDISRQNIDFTSPSAWDILIGDLSDVYAIQTETAIAVAFAAGATGGPYPVAANDLASWSTALYNAAASSYNVGKRMPDRIWCSLDVWAQLGALVDVARMVFPQGGNGDTAAGSASLADFRGDVLGLPRIVVPTLPAGTCIVGPSSLYEVYEEMIGLLSVIEPSILGVEVAYGGYVAQGSLGATAFVKVTPPAGGLVLEVTDVTAPVDGEADEAPQGRRNNAGK
jgi:HK97 family phage major capsid protein